MNHRPPGMRLGTVARVTWKEAWGSNTCALVFRAGAVAFMKKAGGVG